MRNLWLFLAKNYAHFLFVLLEVIALAMIIDGNNYQKASVLNSSNRVIGSWFQMITEFEDYLSLAEINDSLASENLLLKNQVPNTYYSTKVDSALMKDTVTINDSTKIKQYKYIIAKVINNSVMRRNNYLTLNRGSLHGIRKNMGVFCNNGVVGIVKEVSDHYCTVISLLHKDIRISAQTVKTHDFGSLTWDGLSPRTAQLVDIPNHVTIQQGDAVVTTSYSSIFPEGIQIGIVKSASIKSGDNFYTVEVKLSTPFEKLEYVYVIDNLMGAEQQQLEQTLKYE